MQKGSLATMTIDRAQKSKKAGGGLNANELRDCFTLKDERCSCDTRQKVANWHDYGEFMALFEYCESTQLKFLIIKTLVTSRRESKFDFSRLSRCVVDGDCGKGGCQRRHAIFRAHRQR